ncbi:MAG TPA: SigB/SigF/SigG family RNA polymerase sigma factor [Solirubrobacteraceae bacterium]|nr:SigB/SigF/SigG family RNA polymerase sigma factor [Solirubrobacteraceae bacterium]
MSAQPRHNAPGSASAGQLFEAWQRRRDRQAREQLIERFLPLARKLAARYARSNEPFDDLVQVASVGLIKAIERYDPGHGAAFTTFAVPTILGELKRHFRDTSWTVQVDRRAQERARAVLTAQRAIMAVGRAPTVMDIAQFLECDAEEVLEGLQAALAYSPVSLDAPVDTSEGDEDWSLSGRVGAADEGFDHVDERATIDAAVQHLPKLEREVLYLRFGEDLSQRQIADRIGVSQMHVSRLLRRALDRLREQLGPEVTEE